MFFRDRKLLFGLVGASLALVAPALADGTPEHAIDPSRLVRFEDRSYIVDYDDTVSTDPISVSKVKKIEAGKVSWVTITTTATGTYSSEAMFSPHILYPGISVEPEHAERNRFSYWTNGRWSSFSTGNAGSFHYYRLTRR